MSEGGGNQVEVEKKENDRRVEQEKIRKTGEVKKRRR